MIRLIINADDLGKNSTVNAEIEKALSKGVITSSTVLANTVYWSDVLDIVSSHPEASFGAHLNCTEGKALTNSSTLREYGIVDSNNEFTREILKVKKFSTQLLAALLKEWDEQVTLVEKKGVKISHFDGHHHVHTIYGLLPILIELKKRHHIKANRNRYSGFSLRSYFAKKRQLSSQGQEQGNGQLKGGQVDRKRENKREVEQEIMQDRKVSISASNVSGDNVSGDNVGGGKKSSILFRLGSVLSARYETYKWRRKIYSSNGIMPHYFEAYSGMLNLIARGMIISDNSTMELMCHPGHEKYKDELSAIYNKSVYNYLKELEPINYKQL